jgi:hypothetical protein
MSDTTIYSAVAKAMGDVERVAKDSRNNDQKYDFASVDDFMAMVGPICSEYGLVTILDEETREFIEKPGKYGSTQWVAISYQITTWHESGEQLPTVRRHVEVIRNGPQAYGAAQSYILKQYYRGLLNIPTGDSDDPDHSAVPEEQSAPQQQQRKAPPEMTQRRLPTQEAINRTCEYIREATDMGELKKRWENATKDLQATTAVIAAKDAAKERLSAPQPDLDDTIPYEGK